jgi:hypothetical protein
MHGRRHLAHHVASTRARHRHITCKDGTMQASSLTFSVTCGNTGKFELRTHTGCHRAHLQAVRVPVGLMGFNQVEMHRAASC